MKGKIKLRWFGVLVILILIGIAAQINAKQSVINANVTMEKSHLEPGICCIGGITFVNVKPGEEIYDSFQVGNCGDEGSSLNWEITEKPTWGEWSFNPSIGNGLQKDEWEIVFVSIKAPDESGADYTGVIKIIDTDTPSDFCTIDVHIITPRILRHLPYYHFLEKLVGYPILHSILTTLLKL